MTGRHILEDTQHISNSKSRVRRRSLACLARAVVKRDLHGIIQVSSRVAEHSIGNLRCQFMYTLVAVTFDRTVSN